MRAEAGPKPILGGKRRSAWQVAVELYQGQTTFRGFAEFALIGAVVLLFLHGVDFKFLQGVDFRGVRAPNVAPSQNSATPSSPAQVWRLPNLSDVMFDEAYFSGRPEPLRSQLIDATRALKTNDFARVKKLLIGADPTDRWVQLVLGAAAIASPDPQVFVKGLELLKQSALHADLKAMSILGVVMFVGYGGQSKDVDLGRQYLQQAAVAGDTKAARVLAAGYITGWAGRVDLTAAAGLMRGAAEQGDAEAMFQYGVMLGKGVGVAKDTVQSETWLLDAAELGHPGAQSEFGLAKLGDYNRQLTTDAGPAIKWLSRAAEQGEADAMYWLGIFFTLSKPSTGYQDTERGAQLLQKCSEKTLDSRCTFAYATSLESGHGVPFDPVQAFAFYRLSQDMKSTPSGAERLAAIEKQLPPADLEKGRALSRQIREQFFARDGRH